MQFLQRVVKKLRYGGKLIIEGTDLMEVQFALNNSTLSPLEVQPILFAGRYTCYTIENIIQVLRQLGLIIIKHSLMQYKYSIVAERKKNV